MIMADIGADVMTVICLLEVLLLVCLLQPQRLTQRWRACMRERGGGGRSTESHGPGDHRRRLDAGELDRQVAGPIAACARRGRAGRSGCGKKKHDDIDKTGTSAGKTSSSSAASSSHGTTTVKRILERNDSGGSDVRRNLDGQFEEVADIQDVQQDQELMTDGQKNAQRQIQDQPEWVTMLQKVLDMQTGRVMSAVGLSAKRLDNLEII